MLARISSHGRLRIGIVEIRRLAGIGVNGWCGWRGSQAVEDAQFLHLAGAQQHDCNDDTEQAENAIDDDGSGQVARKNLAGIGAQQDQANNITQKVQQN